MKGKNNKTQTFQNGNEASYTTNVSYLSALGISIMSQHFFVLIRMFKGALKYKAPNYH